MRLALSSTGAKPWSVTVIQDCPVGDPRTTALGEGWYAKRVGVRTSMLGEEGTRAYMADTPQTEPYPRKPPPGRDEIGGVTIVAARQCPRTTSVALHEPFKAASPRIAEFRRIAPNDRGLAVAAVGKPGSGVDDRLMLGLGDDHDEPLTLTGNGETFVFANYGYVRLAADKVIALGDIRAMKLRLASPKPRLVINDEPQHSHVTNGYPMHQFSPRIQP